MVASWLSEHAGVCDVKNKLESDPDFYRQHKSTLDELAFLITANNQDFHIKGEANGNSRERV